MKAPSDYLLAAKRCELSSLLQLRRVVSVVSEIAELIHCLQRERGASNLFLSTNGSRFADERAHAASLAQERAEAICLEFEALSAESAESAGNMRLFNRIAVALVMLEGLQALRVRILSRQLSSDEVIETFSAAIANLLAVVTEAVDAAADPAISRLLIALFHLMQGKEFSGQERAVGVGVFATGRLSDERRERLLRLIETSERCFEVFLDYAAPASQQLWHDLQTSQVSQRIERMRRNLLATGVSPCETDLAMRWFEDASERLDGMREVEESLSQSLRSVCAAQIRTAQTDLLDHTSLLEKIPAGLTSFAVLMEGAAPAQVAQGMPLSNTGMGPQLGASVVEMLQAQTRRIQEMEDELAKAKLRFNESNLVERAKGLLMARQGMSAEQAHRLLRQTAMNQNRRLVDIAQATLTLMDMIPTQPAKPDSGASR